MLPRNTALILIDIQQGLAALESDYFGGHRNNPHAEANAARLLEAWRARGMPLVHIQHDSVNAASPLRPGLPTNDVQKIVEPIEGEPVMRKTVNSAFIGTGLEDWLRDREILDVVLCGLTTNHCVETSTRMAGNLGFQTILVADACATFDRTGVDGIRFDADTIHNVSLANLHGEFANVMTTSDILSRLN